MTEWFAELPDELRKQMIAATVIVILCATWFVKFYVPSMTFGIEKIQRWFKVEINYDSEFGHEVKGAKGWAILAWVCLLIFAWLIVATLAPAVVAYCALALLVKLF